VLQECCNQKKTQWKYWTQWTFRPLKNAKIQTKTHEMDVLETVENETLESHSRGPGFESLCAHNNEPSGSLFFCFNHPTLKHAGTGSSPVKTTKAQAILLENKAEMANIKACCRNHQEPLSKLQRRLFLFKSVRCCKSVANTMA
jgi:hypothetical protein